MPFCIKLVTSLAEFRSNSSSHDRESATQLSCSFASTMKSRPFKERTLPDVWLALEDDSAVDFLTSTLRVFESSNRSSFNCMFGRTVLVLNFSSNTNWIFRRLGGAETIAQIRDVCTAQSDLQTKPKTDSLRFDWDVHSICDLLDGRIKGYNRPLLASVFPAMTALIVREGGVKRL